MVLANRYDLSVLRMYFVLRTKEVNGLSRSPSSLTGVVPIWVNSVE